MQRWLKGSLEPFVSAKRHKCAFFYLSNSHDCPGKHIHLLQICISIADLFLLNIVGQKNQLYTREPWKSACPLWTRLAFRMKMASAKLLYASRGAFTANKLYIRVNTQQQTCSTNFKDCKYNCLWEPFHLSKYFHKEQVVLSFLIRQQVTKEIDGIALLPVHVVSLIMRKRSILSHVSNYQKGNKEKHQK